MKCIVRPTARDDILRQYRYYLLAQAAPVAAQRFLKAVQGAVSHIRRLPASGSAITTDNRRLMGLRSWPVKGFESIRVYYLLRETEIRIIRVLHGSRDVHPLLEQVSEEES